MIRMLMLLALNACWAQTNIAVTYGTLNGTTGGNTNTLNSASLSYGVIFSPGASSLSLSTFSVYSGTRGTANVDNLTAELFRNLNAQIGVTVTYTDASDIVNLSNHPFTNGDMVKFVGATSLPAGIDVDTVYYVCNSAATTFQIDNDSGCGSVVTDFSGSSGTQTIAWYIANSTTFSPSPVTVGTWVDFSSFSSHTLVAGARYTVIIRNTEAAPGTDTIRIDYTQSETPTMNTWWVNGVPGAVNGTTLRGYTATPIQISTGYVELSNGEKYGGSYNLITTNDSNARVHGTREVGAKITTPSNIKYNVVGIGTQLTSVTGTTYPKSVTLKLYLVGGGTDTLVDSCTSATVPIGGSRFGVRCLFSSANALTAGASYRIVAGATSSAGDSTNYISIATYSYRSGVTFDIPLSTGWTYCASSCTTTANWTNSSTATAAFALLLDATTPYASQGAGGTTGGSFVIAQ